MKGGKNNSYTDKDETGHINIMLPAMFLLFFALLFILIIDISKDKNNNSKYPYSCNQVGNGHEKTRKNASENSHANKENKEIVFPKVSLSPAHENPAGSETYYA
jgi:hypothetical protein